MIILDTFPTFLDFWENFQNLPVDEQIDGWAGNYLSQWSELLHKQIDDYTDDGYDWREVAKERIFPTLDEVLPTMISAYDHLSKLIEPVYSQAKEIFGFEIEVVFVIHVGIGCGAGWVTTYDGSPAVLFGLENIAEEGWNQPETLRGLIAHEIGHLTHFHWRDENNIPKGKGPWWQLYTEGFANWCEHQVSANSWHMNSRREGGWLPWCQENSSWLASEFLRRVYYGKSVRDFFSSWFNLKGYKQCGYFLGHEVVKELSKHASLKEVALLEDYETAFRRTLEANV
jgi:hypothetical protein